MRQSWNRSGRTGQDRTRPDETGFLPVHPAGQNRIFTGSSGRMKPDSVSLTSKMNRPDFCQFEVKNESAGF
jgi:hypothetical protein